MPNRNQRVAVERIQTGVRMEKRMVKMLKALAEYHDMSLGNLLEGIVLHAFDGTVPFGNDSMTRIEHLRRIYDFDVDASFAHKLEDAS